MQHGLSITRNQKAEKKEKKIKKGLGGCVMRLGLRDRGGRG